MNYRSLGFEIITNVFHIYGIRNRFFRNYDKVFQHCANGVGSEERGVGICGPELLLRTFGAQTGIFQIEKHFKQHEQLGQVRRVSAWTGPLQT